MGTTGEVACSGDKVGSRKAYMQHRRGRFRRANRHRACSRGRGRARCCSRRGREILGTRCPGAVLGLLFLRPWSHARVQSRWWCRVVGMGNLWRCPAIPWCTWRRRVEERQRLSSLALRLARIQESIDSAPIANYDRHPAAWNGIAARLPALETRRMRYRSCRACLVSSCALTRRRFALTCYVVVLLSPLRWNRISSRDHAPHGTR